MFQLRYCTTAKRALPKVATLVLKTTSSIVEEEDTCATDERREACTYVEAIVRRLKQSFATIEEVAEQEQRQQKNDNLEGTENTAREKHSKEIGEDGAKLQAKYAPPKSPNNGSGASEYMSTKAAPRLKVIIPAETPLSIDEKCSIMETCASGILNMMKDNILEDKTLTWYRHNNKQWMFWDKFKTDSLKFFPLPH
uniref:Uncharacterized protein n=1 Tax=Glossina austeni TaxID=7395 RepID=A0A1A9UD48_GLOAU